MRNFGDLNRLIDFARENAVSVIIDYSESSDEMSLEVVSAAQLKNFYVKRIIDIEWFIAKWHNRDLDTGNESGENK